MSPIANPVPVVLWLLALLVFLLVVGADRDLLARAAIATVGSAFVAYGLRELLRAFGGGYYCCNHAIYATIGLAFAGAGWLGLVAAIRGPILATGD